MSEQNSIKILSGKYELILSKSIIMDSLDSELAIDMFVEDVHMGKMKFRFLADEGGEISLKSEGQNGDLILECLNFDTTTDVGTIELMPLGKVNGKEIKMHLWTKLLGNRQVRKVEICLYKEQ